MTVNRRGWPCLRARGGHGRAGAAASMTAVPMGASTRESHRGPGMDEFFARWPVGARRARLRLGRSRLRRLGHDLGGQVPHLDVLLLGSPAQGIERLILRPA